ncbi:hypothetical protein [Roseivirga echinicomitans]|uniref:Uncharacterized protein n=1 Tax=Roseivirga echinicomitans TaxID=296218 RepID=A0A150XJ50_9BACT|nr:hypothetical protein [Roseivirga echinicomitans]KYG78730.1 hypothetical protein AWN68_03605 [Roseivirga echinicomitans]
MTKMNEQSKDAIWEMIDREKKKDVFVKRISKIGWTGTVVMLLFFLTITLIDLSRMVGLYGQGVVSRQSVINTVVPFAIVLGGLCLIIAILSTIGVFLRMRTTSLLEIQQRLANLEQMVVAKQ